MKTTKKSNKRCSRLLTCAVGTLICCNLIAGYCVIPSAPLLCGHIGGRLPGRTSVFCDFGGVRTEFYNGVYEDPVDIYTPMVRSDGDTGAMGEKLGPLQTSGSHIYSVEDCIQSVQPAIVLWVGCSGWVPNDDPCPPPAG